MSTAEIVKALAGFPESERAALSMTAPACVSTLLRQGCHTPTTDSFQLLQRCAVFSRKVRENFTRVNAVAR